MTDKDFDLSDTIAANSDQLNADDLMAGPKTFTITDVSKGTDEQKVFIHLAELPGKTYRPSKTMRRLLVAAWGGKGSTYVGRRVTLYRDPAVLFGGKSVGGIKISHASHLERPITAMLNETRGKKVPYTVDPLPDAAPEPTIEQVSECTDETVLMGMWRVSGVERQAQIQARVTELRDAEGQS